MKLQRYKFFVRDWEELLPWLPEWEKIDGKPFSVVIKIVTQEQVFSLDIVEEWDEIAEAHFYFRDWDVPAIPSRGGGPVYWSTFYFQKKGEAVRFCERYAGYGNWQEVWKEVVEFQKEWKARWLDDDGQRIIKEKE